MSTPNRLPLLRGFHGGRDVALSQLRSCWEEGGIQASLSRKWVIVIFLEAILYTNPRFLVLLAVVYIYILYKVTIVE